MGLGALTDVSSHYEFPKSSPNDSTALCQPRRVGRTAAPGYGRRLWRHPARVVEGPPQQHLDVGVEAAELVSGPPGQGIVDHRVDAQQHLFAFIAHV